MNLPFCKIEVNYYFLPINLAFKGRAIKNRTITVKAINPKISAFDEKKTVLTEARGSVLPPRDIEITIITAIKTPTKLSPTIR